MRERSSSPSRPCKRLNASIRERISGALRLASGRATGSSDRSTRSTASARRASGLVSRCMTRSASRAIRVPKMPAPNPTGRPSGPSSIAFPTSMTSVSPVRRPTRTSTVGGTRRENNRLRSPTSAKLTLTGRPPSACRDDSIARWLSRGRIRCAVVPVFAPASIRAANVSELATRSTSFCSSLGVRSISSTRAAMWPGTGRVLLSAVWARAM